VTKRILVVEDQEDLRGVLRDLLAGSGYEMFEAPDGQAGVDKAKAEKPDLILMDIQMPVMDGYEATRQIKGWPQALMPLAVPGQIDAMSVREYFVAVRGWTLLALLAPHTAAGTCPPTATALSDFEWRER